VTPYYTTLYRFLCRLEEDMIHRAIAGTVQQIKANNASATLAVDATGLAPGSISTFFINHKRDRSEGLPWRYWLKCLVSVDISDQILVSQMAKCGPQNDCAELRPLTEMKANLPFDEYRFRNLVETVFSAVKRKFSAKAPGRSLQTQQLQALLLGLAYNIYKLRPVLAQLHLKFGQDINRAR
jgi:hypothetical protein